MDRKLIIEKTNDFKDIIEILNLESEINIFENNNIVTLEQEVLDIFNSNPMLSDHPNYMEISKFMALFNLKKDIGNFIEEINESKIDNPQFLRNLVVFYELVCIAWNFVYDYVHHSEALEHSIIKETWYELLSSKLDTLAKEI